MASTESQFAWTSDRILGVLGAMAGAAASVLAFLESLENPKMRWAAWAIVAVLFAIAAVQCRDQRAKFLQDGSISTRRARYVLLTLLFAAALLTDVLVIVFRNPIKFTGMNRFEGTAVGYTSGNPDNPLIAEGVANVLPIVADVPDQGGPFEGVSAAMQFQKRKGIDHLLLHDCMIIVDKFEEMPPFITFGGAAGAIDSIKAAFTLKRKDENLPWTFTPTDIAFNGKTDIEFPLIIEDFVPVDLQYYIHASDPGIYWVRCIVVFSDGVGPKKEVMLTERSIPLAFYKDISKEKKVTELEALQGEEWIPIPSISEQEKSAQIKMLQNFEGSTPGTVQQFDFPPQFEAPPAQ